MYGDVYQGNPGIFRFSLDAAGSPHFSGWDLIFPPPGKILFDNGYAGQVVKTFGEFVIRGNAIIGFIIFLIIVLVQFIVITKGSERVAEVAARFTLDAMPGKQMAIDADLNTGLIDEQEARIRRSKVQREADFFGSMDGATKFVKEMPLSLSSLR